MKLFSGYLVAFGCAFLFFFQVSKANAEPAFGPVECYRYAKSHTDLSSGSLADEQAISDLCALAKDEGPATCYERAVRYGGAPRKTAVAICRHRVIEVINQPADQKKSE